MKTEQYVAVIEKKDNLGTVIITRRVYGVSEESVRKSVANYGKTLFVGRA